jgi:hypothetical protein
MFYFDHFKVFVREPGAHAGYNLWFAPPLADDDRPYWWGGRQRQAPRERPAIEVAAQVRDRTRTFEVALPWAWLEAYPQPGDRFDALFLFVDSDAPGSEVATKIGRAHDRWIWWEGDLQLTGTPDGLRPRPVPEEKVTTAPPVAPAPLDARVAGAIARSRQADSAAVAEAVAAARADSEAAAESRPAAAAAEPSSAATSTEPTTSASVATTDVPSSTGSLRARLNRQRLARRAASRAPEWMRPFATGSTTATQVDSYYTVLQRQLRRIVVDDVSTRIDVYVVDMAAAAASDRGLARRYLVALLRWLHEAPDETVSAHYRHVEGQLGIDAQRVADFVRAVSGRSAELFEGHETTTTRELLRRGAREAGLSETEAVRVLGALAGIEGG